MYTTAYMQRERTRGRGGWQKVGKWYHKAVGEKGHYYHTHVILPKSLQLLDLKPGDALLDVGCGQGVLARAIPKGVDYTGIDTASDLIEAARGLDKNPTHRYVIADATKPWPKIEGTFTHATCILALQNMPSIEIVLAETAAHLKPDGRLLLVLNHPCFRIPRQSGWKNDENTKQQYRFIFRYLSPLTIPIKIHPSQAQSQTALSYHLPLEEYFSTLSKVGMVVTGLEEWSSDKESVGKAAKAENQARAEIPLFMAIVAKKESRRS